jgi:hypothetical protein
MSRVHDLLTAPARLATRAHFAWWQLLNAASGYKVAPFNARYWWTRARLVTEVCDQVLASPTAWETVIRQPRFRHYDERVVEYSWAMSRIAAVGCAERYLDVGCVLNTEYCLRKLTSQFKDIHFLNLVSEPLALHGRISYHCEDVRASNLRPGWFDVVTCLSTIEHVGGDNSYNRSPNGTAELAHGSGRQAWKPAFQSLLGLVKSNGLLLVSMPFGEGNWRDGYYEFGPADVAEIHEMALVIARQVRTRVYGKDDGGWRYLSEGNAVPPANLPSTAAGSRAVLLVETL